MNFRDNYHQLARRFATQQQLANALGCSQTAVCKWLNGQAFMSARYAKRAEKLTNREITAEALCPDLAEPA